MLLVPRWEQVNAGWVALLCTLGKKSKSSMIAVATTIFRFYETKSRCCCPRHLKMVSVEMVVLEGAEVHSTKRTLHGVTVSDAEVSCLPGRRTSTSRPRFKELQ